MRNLTTTRRPACARAKHGWERAICAGPTTSERAVLLLCALVLALGQAGCMAGGAMRSTTVAAGSGTRGSEGTAERRSSGATYGSYGGSGGGGGGGGDSGGEYAVLASTGASTAVYASEPMEESSASYSFADEDVSAELAGGYRGEESPASPSGGYGGAPGPASPATLPPADATVARLLEIDGRTGGEPSADAGRVVASAGDVAEAVAETATDATPGTGPLLIYTAGVWLAVYEVRESQATIVARAEELGGFVQHQTDTELALRVPAAQFDALVEAVTAVGDLIHREIAANDVSEEFHDVEIRIRNLEAMRERLEVLLTQATAVEDALRVERELERVTVELERLRGRQRFLSDRIAFATITIHFEARPRDRIDQPEIFALPFYWLQNLGLPRLLDLH